MYFKLPELNFLRNKKNLSPLLTPEAIAYHYEEHHRLYVEKLNELLSGSDLEGLSLEKIVEQSDGQLFNNAAQAWNHTFYWLCIQPREKINDLNTKKVLSMSICETFQTLENFSQKFVESGKNVFGSGWVWLIEETETKQLKIVTTHNADSPLKEGHKPLLVCDVWEHAYYVDYHHHRENYLQQFLRSANWDYVEENLISSNTPNITQYMQYN